MIIDFSIKNYRSIKDKQTLSFVAKSRKGDKSENNISVKDVKGFNADLSKGCVIYGHNASGKTNLLSGVEFFTGFIINSQRELKPSEKIPIPTFMLDTESRFLPSEFEINFIIDNVRYNYELQLNNTRVLYESLQAYPNAIAQIWYSRRWDNDDYNWYSGDHQKYGFDEALAKKTRENVSFLSFANEEKNDILRKIYDWFCSFGLFRGDLVDFPEVFTADALEHENKIKSKVLEFMKCADIGICGLKISKDEFSPSKIPQELKSQMPKEVLDDMITKLTGKVKLESTLMHAGSDGHSYPIDFLDESDGTRKLYKLLGPIFSILDEGQILFFDEIENNLHPLLLIEILSLFFSDLHNKNGAQIAFTAHNTFLLDSGIFNRNQIWFAEKGSGGITHVYPLLDYSPRETENLVKGYIAGKYGAIKKFNRDAFNKKIIEMDVESTNSQHTFDFS